MAVDYAKQHRLQGPVPDRAEAEGADQAPVRFRRRQRHRLPAHLRPRQVFQVQHRDQPRDARRATPSSTRSRSPRRVGMLGSIDANAGDMLLGWDTDQFNTDVKELTLAMVSILRAGGLGIGRLQLRRQAAPALDRPGGPLPRAHRRHGRLRAGLQARAPDPRRRQARRNSSPDRYASFDTGYGKRHREAEDRLQGAREARARQARRAQAASAAGRNISRTC